MANPKLYRITDAIVSLEIDWWKTARSQIRKGDGVVIWQTLNNRKQRGVIALGAVVAGPEKREDASNPFHIDPNGSAENVERVGVRYLPLRNPLWIGGPHDALVRDLSAARSRGPVFRVTPEQWKVLAAFALKDVSDFETTRGGIFSSGQGRGLIPQEPKAVAGHAMKLAINHYRKT